MDEPEVDDDTAASNAAVVLPLLGLFLLMPPVITLFARGTGFVGVPLIVLYVFGVWGALIAGAALLARRLGPEPSAEHPPEGDSRDFDPS
ncbi:MAG TPA: hypothetical protein PKA16_06330 [Ottowia sp.]|uniref:hypothetical protein n=1 Tax=Ottowia sp. TaxID=1898956 RepID=UPI002C509EDF|nr:hypothetical protein [Ottowia sp.]HMN20994.1 hypothetical protein [Ottowia sp.]